LPSLDKFVRRTTAVKRAVAATLNDSRYCLIEEEPLGPMPPARAATRGARLTAPHAPVWRGPCCCD